MKQVNQILTEHASHGSNITVKELLVDRREADETEQEVPTQPYVLIEGDANALRFSAERILAQIDSNYGCQLDIHPKGAGSAHFTAESTLGIYVHRLPCDVPGADETHES